MSVFAKPGDVFEIATDRLAGVWLVPDQDSDRLSVRLVVLAGERDVMGPEGLAHYTEHLVWANIKTNQKGTKRQHSNAWTTSGRTVYFIEGVKADLDSLLERVSRVFDPISISEGFALNERSVVQREYGVRYASNWGSLLNNESFRALNRGTVHARQVIGSPASIESFSLDQAKAFHERTYRPENAVLLVRGKVSRRALKRAVKRQFGGSDVPDLQYDDSTLAISQTETRSFRVFEPDATGEEVWWMRSALLDGSSDPVQRNIELSLLNQVLSSRLPGSLARALRYDRFILARFGLQSIVYGNRYASLRLTLHPDAGVAPDAALLETRDFFESLRESGIPKSTLDKIKARELSVIEDSDPVGLVAARAEQLLEHRRPPESVRALRKRIASVSVEDLQRLLDSFASPTRELIYTIFPDEGS